MKTFTSLFACFAICTSVFAQGTWTQKANFGGTARFGAVGFSIGNKGYIGTGRDASTNEYQDFWEWDQLTNAWTQKSSFPGTARDGAVGFSIGNKGYIGTGWDGAVKQDFLEWDQGTNTWSSKANFTGVARSNAVGFSIGTKGYIGTGYGGSNDFWEYDQSTNAWMQKATLGGTARYWAVGFSIGTKGYIGTGYDGTNSKQDFWEWNQSTNIWTQKANFSGGVRRNAVGFSIGTKGYIGTGTDGTNSKQDFWEYNTLTNAWVQKPNFGGTARFGAVGFSIGNKGYIGTGTDGVDKKDFWEYDRCATFSSSISSSYTTCVLSASIQATGGTIPYTYLWSTSATTPTITGITPNTYSATITDNNNCIISNSVTVSNPVNTPSICLIDVDSLSNYNIIVWDKTSYTSGDTFIVYRDTGNFNFAPVGKIPFDSLSMFIDTARSIGAPNGGNPNIASWRYKLAVKDSCGSMSAMSLYHQTVFFQNNSGNFNWSQYQIEGQTTPIPALSNYKFLRDNISNGTYITIATLSASSVAFTDASYSTYQTTGTWRVKTVWSISCTPTIIKNPQSMATTINTSKSNNLRPTAPNFVNEISLNNSVSIFPNPNSGEFKVLSPMLQVQSLEVYNIYGEIVQSEIVHGVSSIVHCSLSNGIYFAHIKTERGIVVKKIVITN